MQLLNDATRTNWLQSEYLDQFGIYDGRERTWLRRQTLLTLALVGFGLVGSISAALGSGSGIGKTLAIVAGALVASLTTINQVWSPASRSEAYRVGYGAMRDEGWDFVLERGAYEQFKTKTGLERAAFDTFSQRITQIDRRARDVEQPGDVAAGRR